MWRAVEAAPAELHGLVRWVVSLCFYPSQSTKGIWSRNRGDSRRDVCFYPSAKRQGGSGVPAAFGHGPPPELEAGHSSLSGM